MQTSRPETLARASLGPFHLEMRIIGGSKRQRRFFMSAVLRQIQKVFKITFDEGTIEHFDDAFSPPHGSIERPLSLRQATAVSTPAQTDGTRFRAERLKRGWTQAQMAEKLGITRSQLSRIEHGHSRLHPRRWRAISEG